MQAVKGRGRCAARHVKHRRVPAALGCGPPAWGLARLPTDCLHTAAVRCQADQPAPTSTGCVMKGSPLLRFCPECASYARLSASRTCMLCRTSTHDQHSTQRVQKMQLSGRLAGRLPYRRQQAAARHSECRACCSSQRDETRSKPHCSCLANKQPQQMAGRLQRDRTGCCTCDRHCWPHEHYQHRGIQPAAAAVASAHSQKININSTQPAAASANAAARPASGSTHRRRFVG